MKKIIALVGCLLLTAFALSACGGNDTNVGELPEWANQDQLVQDAQKVVDLVNDRDYDAVAALFVHDPVSGEQLKTSMDGYLDEFGAFKSFGGSSCVGVQQNGKEFVTVLQVVNYENQDVTYQVSFYEDGSLAGLLI